MPLPMCHTEAAILDCLAECRGAVDGEACLAVYLLALRADPAWSEQQVRRVEAGVRRVRMDLLCERFREYGIDWQ